MRVQGRYLSMLLLLGAVPACGGGDTPASREPALDVETKTALAISDDVRASVVSTGDLAEVAAGLMGGEVHTGGCQLSYSFSATGASLSGDCTLPSGDRFDGRVSIDAGGCGAGLRVEIDADLASAARGVEHIAGTVDISADGGRLSVAANLERSRKKDGHDEAHKVAICALVEGALVGVDGTVQRSLDGRVTRSVKADHLVVSSCRELPVEGALDVQREGKETRVEFSRAGDDRTHVSVLHDGALTEVDLARAGCDAAPMALDFSACGGCRAPAALPAGDTMSPDAPADPIPVL